MDNSENDANDINLEDISEDQSADTQVGELRTINASNDAESVLDSVITREESTRDSPMTSTDVTRLLMFLFDASDEEAPGSSPAAYPLEWHSSSSNRGAVAGTRSNQESAPLLPGGSRAADSTPFWQPSTDSTTEALKDLLTASGSNNSVTSLISSFNTSPEKDMRVKGLALPELQAVMETGRNLGDWSAVIRLLSDVFSSYEALSSSFLDSPRGQPCIVAAPTETAKQVTVNTEESALMATMEVDATATPAVSIVAPDDDDAVAPTEPSPPQNSTTSGTALSSVNLLDVRRAWHQVYTVPERQTVVDALMRAVRRLVVLSLHSLLITQPPRGLGDPFPPLEVRNTQQRLLNLFVILYECPFATDPLHFEHLLVNINRAATWLPYLLQARLCRAWAEGVHAPTGTTTTTTTVPRPEDTNLWCLQRILSQLITLRCLTTDHGLPNEDKQLCEAALVLRIVYYASLLAGKMDSASQLTRELEENRRFETETNPICLVAVPSTSDDLPQDPIASILKISPNDCRVPFIPSKDFVNETLNDIFKPREDYTYYRATDVFTELSFMRLPFLLQTSSKIVLLYCDNRMRMLGERRDAYMRSIITNYPQSPFLKLFISRERIVEDALMNLDLICLENPGELKKQLLVEFKDELGVDEGGVSKEFFQLLTEKIFHPIYGMFTFNDELQNYWFNPNPLSDLKREYCLIGVLLGLAIYNDIILNVHFPSVLYRKLVGKLGTFEDLKDARPDLASGLQALLDYDGDEDLATVIDCNFVISYHDVFGNLLNHELKPNGSSIAVNKLNRQEYVELYADYLLNESISSSFNAFRRGFHMVISDSPLLYLFQPDEIELLVCGSKEYNFKELERVTTYKDYTSESPVIMNFWTVVHSMSEQQQRQLLQFTTGSDRIPVGGMSSLKFSIARQGANTDRLPTAHTCFNILLLPEYTTFEQLQRNLLLAITHSQGFGVS